MPEQTIIRVLIVDDIAETRDNLEKLLFFEKDIQVVAKAGTGREAVAMAKQHQPDVVLMDIDMPGMDGIQAVWEIKKHFPEIKVMMLTGTEVDDRVFDLVAAGIEGYVLKQIEPSELVRAIRAVVNGEAYLHPDVMKKVLTRMQPQQPSSISLTPRELEILEWMASPNTYKQIAAHLWVCEETIRSHAKNILEKLNQPNRAQAVLAAMRIGCIKLNEK